MQQAAKHKPATGHEIRDIFGDCDDDFVSSLLDTGASYNEIMQAYEWLNDDDYMGADLKKTLDARIRNVYDILQEDRDPPQA